ncbi:MAG: DUF4293 domain-containing protein [Bacteroidetes bacterium]|nr:DUF4293 domain-containing protein [Bacteroidota bacterium]
MIQRKQTLYLLIASLFAFVYLLTNPAISEITGNMKGSDKVETLEVGYRTTQFFNSTEDLQILNGSNNYLIFTLSIIGVFGFACIFLFGKRKLQLRFASYLLMFDLLLFFMIYYQTNLGAKVFENSEIQWKIAAFMPFILPILHFLALRGIVHDIKLLKSVDRLR